MTLDDAKQIIETQISQGTVDARTHIHSGRTVVDYFKGHEEERELLKQALEEVIADYEWTSPEQFENAAYLTVNMQSIKSLETIVERAANPQCASVISPRTAIAAIRSFQDNASVDLDQFFPILFHWLTDNQLSNLALVTLCDLHTSLTGGFLTSFLFFQQGGLEAIQQALVDVYYRDGNTDEGKRIIEAVRNGFRTFVNSVNQNPLLPSDVKQIMRNSKFSDSHTEIKQVKADISFEDFTPITEAYLEKGFEAQQVIAHTGNTWGMGVR